MGSSGSLCELLDERTATLDTAMLTLQLIRKSYSETTYSHGDIACKLEDKQLTSTLQPLELKRKADDSLQSL